MKKYLHIANKIYNTPWCITPKMYHTIKSQFESYVNGMPGMPMDDDEDPEDMMASNNAQNGIAIIELCGVIASHLSQLETACGGLDLCCVSAQLKAARDNPDVQGIVLYINSPGGQVTGTPEFAALVSQVDSVKPVVAFTDGQMCSAALWIGSQCRAIYATPTAEIGSIGCYIYLEDHTAAMAKDGIKPNPVVSKDTPYKLAGASFKELTPEEKALFQADVDNIKDNFCKAILSKRSVDSQYFDGRTFSGEQAIEANLCDGLVSDMDDVISLFNTTTNK